MRKKLSLVLIFLLGVFLLTGCSNDSDFLTDEAEITAVMEDFGNELIYDIDKMKIEIPAPAFIETDGENNVEEIYANYKMKILFKLDGTNLYLAAYAAPELYYEQEFADQLISSFSIK